VKKYNQNQELSDEFNLLVTAARKLMCQGRQKRIFIQQALPKTKGARRQWSYIFKMWGRGIGEHLPIISYQEKKSNKGTFRKN
jgi:hypothetical protein